MIDLASQAAQLAILAVLVPIMVSLLLDRDHR